MAKTNYLIIEKLQRAARIKTYWPKKTNTETIYKRLRIHDVKTRSLELTDKYLRKASVSNGVKAELIRDYNVGHELDEGAHSKSIPRLTIFGHIKNLTSLISSKLFKKPSYLNQNSSEKNFEKEGCLDSFDSNYEQNSCENDTQFFHNQVNESENEENRDCMDLISNSSSQLIDVAD
ncbi:unnamed protein product, partial [Brachionus calyciflorus]